VDPGRAPPGADRVERRRRGAARRHQPPWALRGPGPATAGRPGGLFRGRLLELRRARREVGGPGPPPAPPGRGAGGGRGDLGCRRTRVGGGNPRHPASRWRLPAARSELARGAPGRAPRGRRGAPDHRGAGGDRRTERAPAARFALPRPGRLRDLHLRLHRPSQGRRGRARRRGALRRRGGRTLRPRAARPLPPVRLARLRRADRGGVSRLVAGRRRGLRSAGGSAHPGRPGAGRGASGGHRPGAADPLLERVDGRPRTARFRAAPVAAAPPPGVREAVPRTAGAVGPLRHPRPPCLRPDRDGGDLDDLAVERRRGAGSGAADRPAGGRDLAARRRSGRGAGPLRRAGRAVHRRRRRGARLSRPPGADGGALRAGFPGRRAGLARLPHGRPGALSRRRRAGLPGPAGPAGQGARRPRRAGRGGGGAGAAPGGGGGVRGGARGAADRLGGPRRGGTAGCPARSGGAPRPCRGAVAGADGPLRDRRAAGPAADGQRQDRPRGAAGPGVGIPPGRGAGHAGRGAAGGDLGRGARPGDGGPGGGLLLPRRPFAPRHAGGVADPPELRRRAAAAHPLRGADRGGPRRPDRGGAGEPGRLERAASRPRRPGVAGRAPAALVRPAAPLVHRSARAGDPALQHAGGARHRRASRRRCAGPLPGRDRASPRGAADRLRPAGRHADAGDPAGGAVRAAGGGPFGLAGSD